MQVKALNRSVTTTARREQIVSATVEVLAEVGYTPTTFARIAEKAGLSSTRLISYHFAGKKDLIGAVVSEVYGAIGRFMAARMEAAAGPRDALHTYIAALVEFIADNGARMQALMTIFLGERDAGSSSYSDNNTLAPLIEILTAGQRIGEFRPFDTFVMAATIQRSIDGLPFLLQAKPDLDLALYADELVTLFDAATRAKR